MRGSQRGGLAVACGALGLFSGCGRIGFDPGSGTDGGVTVDADLCGALADNFDDDATSPVWAPFAATGFTVAESGQLTITIAPSVLGYGGYDSACRRDLRDRQLVVEVLGIPNSVSSVEMIFAVRGSTSNTLGFRVEQNTLVGFSRVTGTYREVSSTAFNATTLRFWRLREAAGSQHWETSPDGSKWTSRHVEPTPIDISDALVRLSAGAFAAQPDPGTATFDNFVAIP